MSTVTDLRSKFSNNHDAQHAKEQAGSTAKTAALRGAVSAFPKSAVASPGAGSPVNPNSSNFKAKAAAAKATTGTSRPAKPGPPPPKKPQLQSNASFAAVRAQNKSQESIKSPTTEPSSGQVSPALPGTARREPSRPSSPSQTAAALASARLTPQRQQHPALKPLPAWFYDKSVPSEQHQEENNQDREEVLPAEGTVGNVKEWLQTLDQSSTLDGMSSVGDGHGRKSPQDSLASFVTARRPSTPGGRNQTASHVVAGAPNATREKVPSSPPLLAPKPVRAISRSKSLVQQQTTDDQPSNHVSEQVSDVAAAPLTSPLPGTRKSTLSSKPTIEPTAQEPPQKPTVPPPRRGRTSKIPTKPSPSPPSSPPMPNRPTDTQLDASRPPSPGIPGHSDPTNAKLVDHMTTSSLANAMVASSLASSRAPSSSRAPAAPALPPRPHHLPFQRSSNPSTRTPSPTKSQRYTMRTYTSPADASSAENLAHPRAPGKGTVAEKAGKGGRSHHLIRKHPHKHHEGSRKRYREEITPRERKRYEGVWAANRGTLPTGPQQQGQDRVSSLVARDIFQRTRLPPSTLAQIYDLIDTAQSGSLGRVEFVVGMWLCDQRLKGRTLPHKVGERVWASVKGVGGVRVPTLK